MEGGGEGDYVNLLWMALMAGEKGTGGESSGKGRRTPESSW